MEKDNGLYLEKERREKAAEIKRLNAENARLREALKEITDAVGSYQTARDKMVAGSRITGAWYKASATLAEKEEK